MKQARLQCTFVDAPLPTRVNAAALIDNKLAGLQVGDCAEFNRSSSTMKARLAQVRKTHGRDMRLIIRAVKPGWTRVWRVT